MQIDQFESQFKSAVKEHFKFEPIPFSSIALVSGRTSEEALSLKDLSSRLLPKDESHTKAQWSVFDNSQFSSVPELIEKVEKSSADLIIAERTISAEDQNLVYGLSSHLDALTQVFPAPVLLLPSLALEELETTLLDNSDVLVNTDHITGDHRLINWGATFAQPSGTLVLAHIEDERAFSHYVEVFSKIPEINTQLAAAKVQEELLKLPRDFIDDARHVLTEKFPDMRIEGIVTMGRGIAAFENLLDRHQSDLLILNTKVEGQLAMGGIAYAIAVEFKHIPLLLL